MSNNIIKKKITSLDLNEYIKSLILLMKPRVMSLVIFTCAVGLLTSNSNTNITDAMIGITLVALLNKTNPHLTKWILQTTPSQQ